MSLARVGDYVEAVKRLGYAGDRPLLARQLERVLHLLEDGQWEEASRRLHSLLELDWGQRSNVSLKG